MSEEVRSERKNESENVRTDGFCDRYVVSSERLG